VRDTRVGDTITHERKPTDKALPGFKPSVPVVFCGLFPSTPTISRTCATRSRSSP
jgi:translation elongation factor EF-4